MRRRVLHVEAARDTGSGALGLAVYGPWRGGFSGNPRRRLSSSLPFHSWPTAAAVVDTYCTFKKKKKRTAAAECGCRAGAAGLDELSGSWWGGARQGGDWNCRIGLGRVGLGMR